MRETRWSNAKEIVIALCVCLAVVGVAWAVAFAVIHTKPRYSTGVSTTGNPYCESFDERVCPIFEPGFRVTLPAKEISR
jgi:hypothetical protein